MRNTLSERSFDSRRVTTHVNDAEAITKNGLVEIQERNVFCTNRCPWVTLTTASDDVGSPEYLPRPLISVESGVLFEGSVSELHRFDGDVNRN